MYSHFAVTLYNDIIIYTCNDIKGINNICNNRILEISSDKPLQLSCFLLWSICDIPVQIIFVLGKDPFFHVQFLFSITIFANFLLSLVFPSYEILVQMKTFKVSINSALERTPQPLKTLNVFSRYAGRIKWYRRYSTKDETKTLDLKWDHLQFRIQLVHWAKFEFPFISFFSQIQIMILLTFKVQCFCSFLFLYRTIEFFTIGVSVRTSVRSDRSLHREEQKKFIKNCPQWGLKPGPPDL